MADKSANTTSHDLHIPAFSLSAGEQDLFQVPDLALKKSGVIFISGPNGCGKTTLLRHLARQLTKHEDYKNHLAFISALHFYERHIPLTGESFVNLYANITEWPDLAQKHFGHLRSKLISEISSGEFQALVIVAHILSGAKIFLMDEPFSHLNAQWISVFNQWIEDESKTRLFLIVTHQHFETEKKRPEGDRWMIDRDSLKVQARVSL